MKNITLYILFALCVSGCGKMEQSDERWDGKEIYLTAETVYSDREILKHSPIVLFKDHLIIKSNEQEGFFSLFKMHGDSIKHVDNFLGIGRGPHELLIGADAHYIPEENMMYLTGYTRLRNIFVPLGDKGTGNLFDLNSWRVYDNYLALVSSGAIPIDSSSILIQMAGEDDRMMAVLDVVNKTVEEIDFFIPDDGINASTDYKIDHMYHGPTKKRPHNNQYAHSSQEGRIVRVFELATDNSVVGEISIFNELPEYSYDGDRIKGDPEGKSGFKLNVTEKYLYLMDDKSTRANYDNFQELFGYPIGYDKEIYVSDWAGNPVAKYMLDVPVVYHSIDKDDNYLYGFSYDEETLEDRLVRFKLPQL